MTGPDDASTDASPPPEAAPTPSPEANVTPSPATDPAAQLLVAAGPPRRPRGRILGGIGVIAAVVGAIGVKLLIGALAVGVATGAISTFFGGPWNKLPDDVRSAYGQRLQAAVGNRLDGLNSAASTVLIEQWVRGGLIRLEDTTLVRRLDLEVEALGRTDEATCAAFGRQAAAGVQIDHDVGTKFVGSLEQASLVDWIGINVDAIEAEIRGSPSAKRVDDASVTTVIQKMAGSLAPAQLAVFGTVNSGGKASDADLCGAIRAFYGTETGLDPQSRAVIARFDIQPSSPAPSP